jgi:hypothetical protein
VGSWDAIGDELRLVRGVSVGGSKRAPEQPAVGRLGAGVAGIYGVRRRGAAGDVNAVIRQAIEERHSRNRSYELPAGALFSGRR